MNRKCCLQNTFLLVFPLNHEIMCKFSGDSSEFNKELVLKNRAIRIISHAKPRDSNRTLFKESKMLPPKYFTTRISTQS